MAPSYSGVWKLNTQYQYRSDWPIDPVLGPRGFFAGGSAASGSTNIVDFVLMATSSSNGTDFGDLTATRIKAGGFSNHTRGLIGGGDGSGNTIDFIGLTTAGNASDFGDFANYSSFRESSAGFASATRGYLQEVLTIQVGEARLKTTWILLL